MPFDYVQQYYTNNSTCFGVHRLLGFYRVNYDERNWDLIWSQLLHDPEQIPTINRAQLVDDAFNLARADLMPYTTALNMAVYLRKETEHAPWRSAFEAFRYVDIMLKRTSAYTSFKVCSYHLLSALLFLTVGLTSDVCWNFLLAIYDWSRIANL